MAAGDREEEREWARFGSVAFEKPWDVKKEKPGICTVDPEKEKLGQICRLRVACLVTTEVVIR